MAKNSFDLSGRVALITGGNKGLGKAMARGLAEAGADIVIASRHENELKAALAEILAGTGRKGHYFVTDVSKRNDVKKLARDALSKMGRVDILVNNAGMNAPQAIDAITDETWDRVLEVNLSSVMALTRELTPQMKERRWGRVVHISSVMSLASKEKRNVYSATKAALNRHDDGQRPRSRAVQHHGELHRPRSVPYRYADVGSLRSGEEGIRGSDGARPLGGARGIGRSDRAVVQRRRQLHHRTSHRRGRRLPRA